jgi:dUTP pyrophosphatase
MLSPPPVKVQVLPHGEGLDLPAYATPGSAGMDLRAAEAHTLQPMERYAVPTGLRVAIPEGWEGQIRPRSGLALRKGLSIPNAPGTIDADYRGELKVLLINLGPEPIVIDRGMRIAQMLITPAPQAVIQLVADLDETERGSSGFGSTGTQ